MKSIETQLLDEFINLKRTLVSDFHVVHDKRDEVENYINTHRHEINKDVVDQCTIDWHRYDSQMIYIQDLITKIEAYAKKTYGVILS